MEAVEPRVPTHAAVSVHAGMHAGMKPTHPTHAAPEHLLLLHALLDHLRPTAVTVSDGRGLVV